MSFRRAASLDSLWSGEVLGVQVGSRAVLLVNIRGTISAFRDECLHKAVRLSGGTLKGDTIVCPLHEWEYDARTGRGENPAGIQLEEYAVKVEDDAVWVDVEQVVTPERRPSS